MPAFTGTGISCAWQRNNAIGIDRDIHKATRRGFDIQSEWTFRSAS